MFNYYRQDHGYVPADSDNDCRWVCVESPDRDEVARLSDRYGVPSSLLNYLTDIDERARVERDGKWMMTIVRIPLVSPHRTMPYITVPLGIISCERTSLILTVCYHSGDMMSDFVSHTRRNAIDVSGVEDFTLRIIYSTAFRYLSYLAEMTRTVSDAEQALEQSIQNKDLAGLMRIQKSLVMFSTSVKGDLMVLERIRRIYGERADSELAEDVEIELRQADNTVSVYSDILESTMSAYASIISNNVNGIMKRMTGVTIVLMLPTLVASLYGMNVPILYGDSPAMFWIILVIGMALAAACLLWLRKLHWI